MDCGDEMIVQAVPEAYSSNFNTLYDPAYHNSRLEVIERTSIFASSNYAVCSLPAPHPDVWRRCLATTNQKSRSRRFSLRNRVAVKRKIEVHFTDPASGAKELFESAFGGTMEGEADEKQQETLGHLAAALGLYQSAVTPPGRTGRGLNCKARRSVPVSGFYRLGPRMPSAHITN